MGWGEVGGVVSASFELGGIAFGDVRSEIRTIAWDVGQSQVVDSDVLTPTSRIAFGRDVPAPSLWRLAFRTRSAGEARAQERVAELAAAWRPGALSRPGEDVPLVYTLAGRRRRVYGRPRSFQAPTMDELVVQGRAVVEATFQPTDPLHYDDVASSAQVGIVPASSSGLILPAAPPWLWSSPGVPLSRRADVGGDAPTPLAVTFRGPVSRPWVTVGGVRVDLTGSLAYDEAVTVDARTRTCLWSAGRSGSAAGLLGPRVRLADLVVPPGQHDVTFGGTDSTGTATCTVTWRAAWRSL